MRNGLWGMKMIFDDIENINTSEDQELFPDVPCEQFWVQGIYADCARECWCNNWSGVKEYVKHLEQITGLKILRIIPFISLYQKRYDYHNNGRDKGVRLPICHDREVEPFILDDYGA